MSIALDAEALAPAAPPSPNSYTRRRIRHFVELAEQARTTHSVPMVLSALGGLSLLGVLAGIGSGDPREAVELVTALPATGIGAAVLTAPALLALIPFRDLKMDSRDAIFAVSSSIARAGRLAWGMVPVLMFTMATSELTMPVFGFIALALGIASGRELYRSLTAAEARASLATLDDPDELSIPTMVAGELLLGAWCCLHALVGLRLLANHIF